MSAKHLTLIDELRLWWEMHGALQSDVVTYYGICAAVGSVQGYLTGWQILGMLR